MKSDTSKIESNTIKINRVEVNMAEIKTDLNYLKEGQKRLDSKLDEFMNSIHRQRVIDKKENDSKYAAKPTEWIVYALVGLILVAVFTAMLTGIFKV